MAKSTQSTDQTLAIFHKEFDYSPSIRSFFDSGIFEYTVLANTREVTSWVVEGILVKE
jgi:hypothetical protein